jgi:uncharacterized membrane protein
MMLGSFNFFIHRIRERLWVRPLLMCIVAIAGAGLAKTADNFGIAASILPNIPTETIETLLKIIASSMLVIATFAVGSMVSSYASASSTATPRSLPLVVSDDVSQNALSIFIGAFIFSIIALIALMSGVYGTTGRFVIFCLTISVFGIVILVFLRWVDSIARLGKLGSTIDKVEAATMEAFLRRRRDVRLGGYPPMPLPETAQAVHAPTVGYVQRLDVGSLQAYAEETELRITVAALPGTFCAPDRPLAFVMVDPGSKKTFEPTRIADAFRIGDDRTFEDDPRFGLVVLSEIAGRALSPAVNDPGTAIDILGTFVRLFVAWAKEPEDKKEEPCQFDRVAIEEISVHDMFQDAFTAIARDGAGTVEVGIRLQKALRSLSSIGNPDLKLAAEHQADQALLHAEQALKLQTEFAAVRGVRSTAGTTETAQ